MQVFRNWVHPGLCERGPDTRRFAPSRRFADCGAYDRERPDLGFCSFGRGERGLPQGAAGCGIGALGRQLACLP
jgi:hypothetical protein